MSVEALWSIHAKRSLVKCVLHVEPDFTEMLVLQDEDVALRQTFADRAEACARADALRQRLIAIGWRNAG